MSKPLWYVVWIDTSAGYYEGDLPETRVSFFHTEKEADKYYYDTRGAQLPQEIPENV